MSDDDLENLTTDDVPDERVEAVKQGLAAQEAIRKLQEENKKLAAALKRGRAEYLAEGYRPRIADEEESADTRARIDAALGDQKERHVPAAANFHDGGGTPMGREVYTAPELLKAARSGAISDADIKRIIDEGRLVKERENIIYHRGP
jgi:hypothetical protein